MIAILRYAPPDERIRDAALYSRQSQKESPNRINGRGTLFCLMVVLHAYCESIQSLGRIASPLVVERGSLSFNLVAGTSATCDAARHQGSSIPNEDPVTGTD